MVGTKTFGSLDGRSVPLITLTGGGLQAQLLPYGAALRSLVVPDREGNGVDVCLGYDTLEEYTLRDAYLGATVGRYANRISGAGFTLNGARFALRANEGRNTLHGGPQGFHRKLWDWAPEGEGVTFSLTSPHGEEGFPGQLRVEVTYTLREGALVIRYRARSDRDTVLNLTNHSYFNLAGAGTVDDHVLTLKASRYTPADEENIPTGELRQVEGTVWDLRSPTRLGDRLSHPDLALTRGYDQNFVLDERQFAHLTCPRTGIAMEAVTDLEGVQLYTAGCLTPRQGKGGAAYGPRSGLCLESQHFPDAVNKPQFPSPILRADQPFCSETEYRFSCP